MKEIDYPIITNRLYIEPYKIDFTNDLYELKQLPQTHRFNYSTVPSQSEISESINDLVNYNYQKPKGKLELVIVLKETGKFIGYTGLKGNDFEKDSTAEIYYTIHPDYFRKGYGTEIVIGMLKFAFFQLELHRIWAGATCENIASWKIMEKVGMRKETHWIKDRPKPGMWVEGKGFEKTNQWEDGFGYAILKEEFKPV